MMKQVLSLVVLFALVAVVPPALAQESPAVGLPGQAPLDVPIADTSTGEPIESGQSSDDEDCTGTWTQVTASAGWSARCGHSSVALSDGSIILMGGGCGNDVWRSTDNGITWMLMTLNAEWSGQSDHSSVVLPDDSIVLMGGYTIGLMGSIYLNDVWRSTDNGATWTQMTASAGWSARCEHSSVALHDGSIVMMGGYDGNSARHHDIWRSTDNGATWTQITANAGWSPRCEHSSVALPDGSIALMGGYSSADDGRVNDVWRSTDNGVTWMQMTASAGWSTRFSHTSVVLPDDSIVLMGGFSGNGPMNDVWRSTDGGTTWILMTLNAGWTPRYDHSSVALPDGSIVLMGGFDYKNHNLHYKNDVWRSTDNGATWTQMTANAEWSPRFSHSSVALPDGSIVLMGGYDGGRTNDVWRSTDNGATWTQVTASAEWSAGSEHSSVVLPDGSIVLMGGSDSDGFTNDVWRSTDNGATWTQVNASTGWTARYGHSSVVLPDGSIVLMGGSDSDAFTNDVWQSTDSGATWALMTANAGWSARSQHSSIVLSDGSIVLTGGHGNGGYKNDVWRFRASLGSPCLKALFESIPKSGKAPLTIRFNDTSTGDPMAWSWTFGDDTASTEQHPVHTYETPGTYTVALTVTNATGGSDSLVLADYITVTTAAPLITDPVAMPSVIPTDTDGIAGAGETAVLSVTGGADVATVTVNLSRLGGSSAMPMTGAENGTWTANTTATVPSPFENGVYLQFSITVNATGTDGASNTSVSIPLTVVKNGDANEDNRVTLYDAVYTARHTLEMEGYPMTESIGEVSGDSELSLHDAMYLAKHLLGIPGFEQLH